MDLKGVVWVGIMEHDLMCERMGVFINSESLC